ncbi:hypothetical protein FRB96_003539 [Tulasnella sp. 330]|nr:hypothetical protein FRB96_003539 [Tulasnella sp. 330]
MEPTSYLKGLNAAQLQAVSHDPKIPLQILAGPGSGKTRVLTCRVAHLVQHHGIPASHICAVTFTNKAANEMRHRLKPLIGESNTNALIMGTFHAICTKYLRKHGQAIDLPNNFSICDADESKKIISKLLKGHASELKAKSIEMKDFFVMSAISKAKSKALSPDDLSVEAERDGDDVKRITAQIYEEYEATLKRNNSLDFDDLLVYGVRLFQKSSRILQGCRHILVDEFQDTSVLQYELVKLFANASQCLTIVGDPDQSIYGWRAAEIENLHKMGKDFHSTHQIYLEENYRSTATILAASHAIVSQDKARIAKGLFTSEGKGSIPVLRSCHNEHAEADFIADEIKRMMAHSGGMLDWNDFVVLLRYNALSRPIESAFQRAGIPIRMLAGVRFFERAEIKDILGYLQLVDNPSYDPAFNRIVNVPARSVGDKSLTEIEAIAKSKGWSNMATAEKISQGMVSGKDARITTKLKKDLPSFVKTIKSLRQLAAEGASVPDLVRRLTDLIDYEAYLQKTHSDWESRWENIRELINFAEETSGQPLLDASQLTSVGSTARKEFTLEDDGTLTESGDEGSELAADEGETPLRRFLQASSLSTDTQTSESDSNSVKVTISTCHAAKGLEWPVVFVPSTEQGTFPFYRTEDTHEERRLLYVACTRAQTSLYLTYAQSRMSGGESRSKELSEFVKPIMQAGADVFATSVLPIMNSENLEIMSRLLRRPIPSVTVIENMKRGFRPTPRQYCRASESSHTGTVPTSNSQYASNAIAGPSQTGPPPSFASAKMLHGPPKPAVSLLAPVFGGPAITIIPKVSPMPKQSIAPVAKLSENVATYFTCTTLDKTTVFDKNQSTLQKHVKGLPAPTAVHQSIPKPYHAAAAGSSKENRIGLTVVALPPVQLAGGKRRLGMGRAPDGFSSQPIKKLKGR